jgi:hypothetical protein
VWFAFGAVVGVWFDRAHNPKCASSEIRAENGTCLSAQAFGSERWGLSFNANGFLDETGAAAIAECWRGLLAEKPLAAECFEHDNSTPDKGFGPYEPVSFEPNGLRVDCDSPYVFCDDEGA